MKTKKGDQKYLQCGYEHTCKNKDCIKCPRRKRKSLSLTYAEEVVIEDFAICDLIIMAKEKPAYLELMQNIMRNIMKKVFKEDKE